jgi:hypothetical protein
MAGPEGLVRLLAGQPGRHDKLAHLDCRAGTPPPSTLACQSILTGTGQARTESSQTARVLAGGRPPGRPSRAQPRRLRGRPTSRRQRVAAWNHPIRVTTAHPGRVQGKHHGDTPAVKVKNMADESIQREVEGGDHRLPLRLDHRGQPPPVDPAAQDRRRRDPPGPGVQRLGPSPQGLHPGRAAAARPTDPRSTPSPPRRPPAPRPGRHQAIASLFPVYRRGRDDARRRAEPPARPGGAPPGHD